MIIFLIQKRNDGSRWEDVKEVRDYSIVRALNFIFAEAGLPIMTDEQMSVEEKKLQPLVREFCIKSVRMRICRIRNE